LNLIHDGRALIGPAQKNLPLTGTWQLPPFSTAILEVSRLNQARTPSLDWLGTMQIGDRGRAVSSDPRHLR